MLIQSLEQKTKLAMMTVIATISGCVVICGFTLWCCMSLVTKEREQIYILDGDIPFFGGTCATGSQLHDGSESAYPAFPSVFLQPAA